LISCGNIRGEKVRGHDGYNKRSND